MATGDLHKEFPEDRSSASRDMLVGRQTDRHTDRQTDRNIPLPYRGRVIIVSEAAEALKRTQFPAVHVLWTARATTQPCARSSLKGHYVNEISICSSVKTRRSLARWVATRPTSHDEHQRRRRPSEGILYFASWFRPARVQGGSGLPPRQPLMSRSERDIVRQSDDETKLTAC